MPTNAKAAVISTDSSRAATSPYQLRTGRTWLCAWLAGRRYATDSRSVGSAQSPNRHSSPSGAPRPRQPTAGRSPAGREGRQLLQGIPSATSTVRSPVVLEISGRRKGVWCMGRVMLMPTGSARSAHD